MTLVRLLAVIFAFNVMTFGNGPLMVALFQKRLVDEWHVLTIDQLLYAFTIARVTPGQANLYVASIGYMLFGIGGAAASMLAIMLPGYLMLPLMYGYHRFAASPVVRGATRGLVSASVGLIVAATIRIGHQTLTQPIAWACFAVALALVQLLRWNPVVVLVVASALGTVLKLLAG